MGYFVNFKAVVLGYPQWGVFGCFKNIKMRSFDELESLSRVSGILLISLSILYSQKRIRNWLASSINKRANNRWRHFRKYNQISGNDNRPSVNSVFGVWGVRVRLCTGACVRAWECACVHGCVCVRVCAHVRVCTGACVHGCVCVRVCTGACACVCARVRLRDCPTSSAIHLLVS